MVVDVMLNKVFNTEDTLGIQARSFFEKRMMDIRRGGVRDGLATLFIAEVVNMDENRYSIVFAKEYSKYDNRLKGKYDVH
jgi:hypothetical protein